MPCGIPIAASAGRGRAALVVRVAVVVALDGNDCESSVCVEDGEGGFTCSGECVDDGDCAAKLPICADVAFVGRICIRAPP